MNGRERITNLVRGLPTDCLPCMPITMLFASDLVGVQYVDYETDHNVQAAAQLELAQRFDLDHVSVISGPGVEAGDCGADVVFPTDGPPALDEQRSLLRDKATLGSLRVPDPRQGSRMSNRLSAVRDLVAGAGWDRIVEGWVEGPCAEAAELRGLNRLMLDFDDDPISCATLVAFVVAFETAFALAQVDAGADIIGMGTPQRPSSALACTRSSSGPRSNKWWWPCTEPALCAGCTSAATTSPSCQRLCSWDEDQ